MKAVVLGKGKSGVAAAKLLEKRGHKVFFYDDKLKEKVPESPDVVIKSPGFPPFHSLVREFKSKNIPIVGEVEFASRFLKGKVIGITGTNGKSTTTAMVYHALNKLWEGKVFIGGNFGIPLSDFVEKTDKDTFTVLELSSFQIEALTDFKVDISAILNISPDHLDRYSSLEEYIKAKIKIVKHTKEAIVLNKDEEVCNSLDVKKITSFHFSMKREADIYLKNDSILFDNCKFSVNELPVYGYHNIQNIMATLLILKSVGFSPCDVIDALGDFSLPEHRLEFVKEINGVKFINDSKSTNIDSLEKALLSFNRVILIAGGKDKGIDFSPLKKLLKERVKKLILIGEVKYKWETIFSDVVETFVVETLEDAVKKAFLKMETGDVVLFSPGCSSFDMFKNFEERGKIFKSIVEKL